MDASLSDLFTSLSFSEIAWPKTMNPLAASTYQLLEYFDKSQWMDPNEIKNLQFQQLLKVLTFAKVNVPFYGDRLSLINESVTAEDLLGFWSQIPILTRADLQEAGQRMHAIKNLPDHGPVNSATSSGSTGRPVTSLSNQTVQFFFNVMSLREHLWAKRDFSKTMAVIKDLTDPQAVPPHGRKSLSWGISTYGNVPTGPCYSLGLCDPKEQLTWLKRINPDYLLIYPTVLREILKLISESPTHELTRLQHVWTFGEIVEPELRRLTKSVLNIPLIDSSTEIGHIALQCPESENYHITSETVFVEVLNDNNEPCAPREIGRVVITTLHNYAFPLIRYEIGDYAEAGSQCVCGRTLPVLHKVLGRKRNMLTKPTGEKCWPSFTGDNDENIIKVFGKNQFQIVQKSLTDMEVNIAGDKTFIDENVALATLKKLLGTTFTYQFNYVNEISRGPRGKYEDFKSLL
jgi:phenylacetate-CoA ligase